MVPQLSIKKIICEKSKFKCSNLFTEIQTSKLFNFEKPLKLNNTEQL